jgi:hypothetical protein
MVFGGGTVPMVFGGGLLFFDQPFDTGKRALSATITASSIVVIRLHSSVVCLCEPQWR